MKQLNSPTGLWFRLVSQNPADPAGQRIDEAADGRRSALGVPERRSVRAAGGTRF